MEGGGRKSKLLPTKALANHFAKIKYAQLNSDVFTGSIDIPWQQAKDEYLQKYDLRGFAAASKYEASRTLSSFEKVCGKLNTNSIMQHHINCFILKRQKAVVGETVNKDISRIRAFLRWLKKHNYHPGNIEIELIKTPTRIIKALTTEHIRKLLQDAPTEAWRVRILLSLTTGLRKNDVESLRIDDLDIKAMIVRVVAQKTGKANVWPIPDLLQPTLTAYLTALPKDQTRLFDDVNMRKTWDAFRGTITRQNFRQTFSTLLQKVGSIGSAQELLQHSSVRVTQESYTDMELILRWKVNQLPVVEWLEK